MRDILYVRFAVQHSLIKVCYAPPLRNIESEKACKLFCRSCRHGVLPGSERHKQIPVAVKGKIAMHHAGNAHAFDVLRIYDTLKRCTQTAQCLANIICPDSALTAASPYITAA